jgi:hypothetical protein
MFRAVPLLDEVFRYARPRQLVEFETGMGMALP